MGGGGADNYHGTNVPRGTSDDGTGGYGGGTVDGVDKTSWSGHVGFYTGKETCVATHGQYPEKGSIDWISKPGRWENDNNSYIAKGYKLFYGALGGTVLPMTGDTYLDLPGGGGGYFGGEASCNCNGGGAGGSAYADTEGKVKKVTDVKGYSGYDNGNGDEMKGRYGNGKLIISK